MKPQFYDTDEWKALYRTICEEPTADLPRLVAADWLDEHDEPEFAEFIRVQCELDRHGVENGTYKPCNEVLLDGTSVVALIERESVIWRRQYVRTLLKVGLRQYMEPRLTAYGREILTHPRRSNYSTLTSSLQLNLVVRRGFISEVYFSQEGLMDQYCVSCGGIGLVSYLSPKTDEVEVTACFRCKASGQNKSLLMKLIEQCPITKVVPTDVPVTQEVPGGNWFVSNEHLSQEYFSVLDLQQIEMSDGTLVKWGVTEGRVRREISRVLLESARDNLEVLV